MAHLPQRAPAGLAGVVTGMAGYDERASAAPVVRRETPTGGCTLILAWGDPLRVEGPAGPLWQRAFLAGLDDGWARTAFTGHQRGVQVDLTPLGAARLLGRDGVELARHAPPLDDLGVPALTALPDRLAETATWDARFARVAATLRDLLADNRFDPDPEVAHAWSRLHAARGRVPVGHLAAETGWSRRHLLTRFHRQVGLAPTVTGRVLRFRHATELLAPGTGPARVPTDRRITDVAAAAGYADHSHLVREFRDLAGCTPGEFLREWFPDVQDAGAPGS
ncbi:AraC family transcriptional regulator [Actinomycetospora sp. NBRC 106375]|uniref:AraC family transcriptional regulator n=1 Tax=Actinomycetospora sp. NBRC 106375 TaxID=3032207 RepID=UPI0024A270D5|nr:helix-turn-helix domain-containing protein [Actinomycetospora sp. NBRC 106375]GLZ49199.1 AraC family transcriptional regulator [Actinomycetospora sp. NBRC 106375]